MLAAAMRLLPIKDLKDLRALLCRRYYRHAGPKGPEESFSRVRAFQKQGGPVPRHRTFAGETRSPARVAGEGPRATFL